MLSVSNLSRSHGGHTILESISFIINRGERAGLIGPNGAGKSTLLRMIAGFEPPDGGSTSLSPGERVGMLRQGFADLADGSLADLLDIPTDGLATAARDLEQTLAASDGSDDWLQTYDAVQTYFDALGGYDRVAELETMLAAFGLESRSWVTPLAKLSGGEKTRAGLAALIVSRPDFLLLDEPTNHLDAEGQRFLADLLRQFDGGVLIVSHDRRFLDEVVTRLLILDDQSTGLELFSGNYSAYREAKEREAELRASAYRRQQEQIARIRGDIRSVASHAMATEKATTDDFLRGRAKKVARTAVVRARKLERMLESTEMIDKPDHRWTMAAEFGPSTESGRDVAFLSDANIAFGESQILSGVDLLVRSGDRIAVTGPNGAGKTTLLKLIAGELQPTSGIARLGANVRPGWFAQEQETLNPRLSPAQLVRLRSELSEAEARAFLHRFLFTAANVLNPVGTLSYGERSRLALALLVLEGCNLLLLDEPLNHLDITSREQFERALSEFDGTLLIVLHDEFAAERIGNRFLRVTGGRVIEEFS
jgi:ATP-binding cassette, subfamily F, member 3